MAQPACIIMHGVWMMLADARGGGESVCLLVINVCLVRMSLGRVEALASLANCKEGSLSCSDGRWMLWWGVPSRSMEDASPGESCRSGLLKEGCRSVYWRGSLVWAQEAVMLAGRCPVDVGGWYRVRTCDPRLVRAMLSQLS